MKHLYLKNLDGLRFLAAALVVLDHCGLFKNGMDSSISNKLWFIYSGSGSMGVRLFFVLSGFLIFFLFNIEKERTNTINLKQFYIRRLLRIWPLYLVIGTFGTLLGPFILNYIGIVTPTEFIGENMLFMLLFAVNIQLIFFTYNPGIVEILWTIGVEEHFYLLMPIILKWVKNLFYPILFLFLLGLASPFILDYIFPNPNPENLSYTKNLHYYFTSNAFSLFGIGAIAGYLFYNKAKYEFFFKSIEVRWFQVLILFSTIVISLNLIKVSPFFYSHILNPIVGLFYSLFILQMVSDKSILNLEFPLLKYLGKVSYGVYLIHPFVAKLLLFLFVKYFANNFLNFDILYPLLSLAITSLFAFITYELFEKQFLKLKHRYSAVKTRI